MKRILIASVLKPVNDARMYEKIAISLSRLEGYEIHVAGFEAKVKPTPIIKIYPIFNFKRLSVKRFLSPWKFYKLLTKVKPEITIVTTHDLLIVTVIYKILFGTKIIYDVQENYFRNIAFTNTYPIGIRQFLANIIRLKEYLTRPFIAHYFLAERNYETEFSFSKGKSTILENKIRKSLVINSNDTNTKEQIKLLYSGTIAEVYGIFEAIDLAIKLYNLDSRVELTIIGYSSKNETLIKLSKKIKPYKFIRLIGGNNLVPHHEILQEIASSHFGLLSYQYNKSTKNCIPTKMYEYLAFRLPMIIPKNPLWESMIDKYQSGISIDYHNPNSEEILGDLTKKEFYNTEIPQDIYWEHEEINLIKTIKSIS